MRHAQTTERQHFGALSIRGQLLAAEHRHQVLQDMVKDAGCVVAELRERITSFLKTREEIMAIIEEETSRMMSGILKLPQADAIAPFEDFCQLQIWYFAPSGDWPAISVEISNDVAHDITFVAASPMLGCWMALVHWLQSDESIDVLNAAADEIYRRQTIGFC
ncbi:hypothetical protein ASG25_21190 [Rhizobium sp. Leaf384]|nr:hypothetical protein ASG25_21190 [Rhizobium sp. Leaf384]KQS83957.1 hypothetical protein ASG58_21570 [Rhizobium sp. Leaf383]